MNQTHTHTKIEKINETKNWFYEEISKIDKPLTRFIKKKRRRNEREVTTDTTVFIKKYLFFHKRLL